MTDTLNLVPNTYSSSCQPIRPVGNRAGSRSNESDRTGSWTPCSLLQDKQRAVSPVRPRCAPLENGCSLYRGRNTQSGSGCGLSFQLEQVHKCTQLLSTTASFKSTLKHDAYVLLSSKFLSGELRSSLQIGIPCTAKTCCQGLGTMHKTSLTSQMRMLTGRVRVGESEVCQ